MAQHIVLQHKVLKKINILISYLACRHNNRKLKLSCQGYGLSDECLTPRVTILRIIIYHGVVLPVYTVTTSTFRCNLHYDHWDKNVDIKFNAHHEFLE